MRSCGYPLAFEYLRCYRSRKNQRCGNSSRKMSAATQIVTAVITHISRIIGVTGSCKVAHALIISRMLICILYHSAKGSACQHTVHHPRYYIREILLAAHCACSVFLRRTSCHKVKHSVKVDFDSAGKPVYHNTDSLSVRFTEY